MGDWEKPPMKKTASVVSVTSTPFKYELTGHEGAVRDVRFCHKDVHIATASDDGTLRLWDVDSGVCISRFCEHEAALPVTGLDLNKQQDRMLSSSWDRTLKYWDMETGSQLWSAKHDSMLTGCALSSSSLPGETLAVSSCNNSTMCMWDLNSRASTKPLHTFKGHSSTVTSCQINMNKRIAVSASMDMTAAVWDLRMPHNRLATLKNHINVVCSCHLTDCGRYLLTSGWDRMAYVSDLSVGEYRSKGLQALAYHEGCIGCCRFSPKGRYIVTCGYDSLFAVWKTCDYSMHYKLKNGHDNWVMAADFSSDESVVATASKDMSVRVWTVTTPPRETYQDPKKMLGLNVQKCARCQREFSTRGSRGQEVIGEEQAHWCVVCRLKHPSRVYNT